MNNVFGLVLGLVMVGLGTLIIVQRDAIARLNASLLTRILGSVGAREAKRSTPQQFLTVGVILLGAGLVGTAVTLTALINIAGSR